MYMKNLIFLFNKNILNYKYVNRENILHQLCKYSLSSCIDKTILNTYIKNLQKEYNSLSATTGSLKRIKELQSTIDVIKQRSKVSEQLQNVKELLKENDLEMKKLAEEEIKSYENQLVEIEEELLDTLIPSENDMCNSIVLEIKAGVGGQEAMLFAKEIFEMYQNFSNHKGWSFDVAELDVSDIGGLRHVSVIINGPEVFKFFKYEAGVHRVQRIPTTEKSGRTHTSTISVVALPQPKEVDVVIKDKDLRIDTMRASGAGGQHVNTTDSAVRIVHLPTNIMVECQVNRSQIKNKEIAMQKLRALLYEKQLNEQIAETSATRKSQVKSNFRNEKIRTYNYSQDRITDHRLHGSNIHNLKVFLEGGEDLENLIMKLHDVYKQKQLLDILTSVNR